MFKLLLTTCIAAICNQQAPNVQYTSVERCFDQAAIIAGATPTDQPYAWRADCAAAGPLGIAVISTTVDHGMEFPENPGMPVGSDALAQQ